MVKQHLLMNKKGFTLIESLLVLFIIAVLLSITTIKVRFNYDRSVNETINDIVRVQLEAIMENDEQFYEENDMDIRFNRLGDADHADSYEYGNYCIIVSLGTGRVYEEDEER